MLVGVRLGNVGVLLCSVDVPWVSLIECPVSQEGVESFYFFLCLSFSLSEGVPHASPASWQVLVVGTRKNTGK